MKRIFYLIFLFLCSCIAPQYLAALATVEGRVTDSVTSLHISGALVELVRGGQVRYSDTTAPNGTYSITDVEPSNYTLVVSAPGYQTQSLGVNPKNNQITTVDVALVPIGGTINGTVTDATVPHPAIVGATIRIFQDTNLIATTTTNGVGFYSVPNLAPGNYTVLASATGFQTQFKGATVQSSTITTVDFALEPTPIPGNISGTVTDSVTTNPIAGALVEVFNGSVLVGFADTDGSGNYTISDLAPGNYTVVASATGYQTEAIGASVDSNMTTTVDFALDQPPGTIAGTVITDDLTGNPIPGATINIFQGITFITSVLTDENGQYEIPDLAPGNYIVSARASGYQRQIKGATVTANTTTIVNFALSSNPGTISGQVTDTNITPNPIAGAAINVFDGEILVASTLTDPNGNYAIFDLAPGDYTVTASKATFQTQAASATVNAGETTIVNFALQSNPGLITGTVIDAVTTNFIPNATVAVFQGTTFIGFTLTDVLGSYTIPGLAPGNYTVLAIAQGYQSAFLPAVVNAGMPTTVDFALEPNPGTIAGTVTDGCTGGPVSGALIVVSDGSTIVGFGLTDSSGNYSIDTLAPGDYTVTAIKSNFLIGSSPATVAAGATTIVNFTLTPTLLPPASISGFIAKNAFLTQTALNKAITWTPSPSECVTGYQVFRNGIQVAFVPSTSRLVYIDPIRNNTTNVYSVRAVNSFGMVSSAISITF